MELYQFEKVSDFKANLGFLVCSGLIQLTNCVSMLSVNAIVPSY